MESSFNQMLLDCYGIFYWQFNAAGQLLAHTVSDRFTNTLLPLFVGDSGIFSELAHHPWQTPFLFEGRREFFWIVCEEQATHNIVIYGPVAIGSQQLQQVNVSLAQLANRQSPDVNIAPFLKQLQIVPLNQLTSIARECYYQLNHEAIKREQILITSSSSNASHQSDAPHQLSAHLDAYQTETAIFDCVKNGNVDYQHFLDIGSQASNGVPVNMGSLENAKLSLLTLNFICSRAAMAGGVSPATAYTLADQYTEECMRCDSRGRLQALAGTLISDFVTRVHQHKRRHLALTPPIAACKEFIDLNVREKIDLASLTAVSGYSYYYLSHEFNRQLGCSINQYINQAKINTAKRLLKTSQQSASDIAVTLHFSSPSYFSKIFRQLTGVSPREYRRKALQE